MLEYIKNKQKVNESKISNFYTKSGIHVYYKNQFYNERIDLERVVGKVESRLPSHLRSNVEMIIVSEMSEFDERDIKALYQDSAIYLSPDQINNEELLEHLLHEFSHAVEEQFGELIYGDMDVQTEFLSKRENLHNIMWKMGHKAKSELFLNPEYDEEFDEFLYNTVGYDKVTQMVSGLFLNAYSATDLREYFGVGFSEYFLRPNEHNYFKTTCPKLFRKLKFLANNKNFD